MAKRRVSKGKSNAQYWTLKIEFTGLMVFEPFLKQKKLIVHIIDDPLHAPALVARIRDVQLSSDCAPSYSVLVEDEHFDKSKTVAIWQIRRAAQMQLFPPDSPPSSLEIPDVKPKPCSPVPCSDSIFALANLKHLLSARQCVKNADDASFLLTRGRVTAYRCNKDITFKIKVNGVEAFEGPLALSLLYELKVYGHESVTIDMHPGKLHLGPPKNAPDGYEVVLTVSNFPTVRSDRRDPAHFMEYNRVVGTDFDIEVTTDLPKDAAGRESESRFPEDPVHCVPAMLAQES